MTTAVNFIIHEEKKFIHESVNYSLLLLEKKLIPEETHRDFMTALKLRNIELDKQLELINIKDEN